MTDEEITKLKEKIEDFICLQLADDIDDYENIIHRLIALFMSDYKKYTLADIRTLFEWDKSLDTKSTKVTRDYDNIHVDRLFQKYKQAFIDLGLLGG